MTDKKLYSERMEELDTSIESATETAEALNKILPNGFEARVLPIFEGEEHYGARLYKDGEEMAEDDPNRDMIQKVIESESLFRRVGHHT